MSTRERVNHMIDKLSEEQLKGLIMLLQGFETPDDEDIPNEETKEALEEVEDMKRHPEKYKGYDDVDLMFKELLA